MKQILLTAALTATITLGIVFVLQFTTVVSTISDVDQNFEKLATGLEMNSKSIAQLNLAVRNIQGSLNAGSAHGKGATNVTPYSELDALLERVEIIEKEFQRIAKAEAGAAANDTKIAREKAIESLTNTTELYTSTQYDEFDAEFEDDSGIPLGDFSSVIEDALNSVDAIQIRAVDCRNTACKVTYSSSDTNLAQGQSDNGPELVDMLAQNTNGHEVEVRYSDDPYGNRVMYILLR